MASQESTAINDLIQLVQGGKVERMSENPVPELFVPAIRGPAQMAPASSVDVPSLARHRAAAGTPAPHYMMPQQGPAYPLPTPIAQGTPAQAYQVPHAIVTDDEQTELWQGTPRPTFEHATHAHAPAQHVIGATPSHAPAMPAAVNAAHAMQTHAAYVVPVNAIPSHETPYTSTNAIASNATPYPMLGAASPHPAYVPSHAPPYALPTNAISSQATPYTLPTNTIPSQATPYTMPTNAIPQHATPYTMPPASASPAPASHSRFARAPSMSPRAAMAQPHASLRRETSHLPEELSPAVRYASLGLLAVAAISIGTYLGASGGGDTGPSERDRAIAIMSGEMPAPPTTTHVTAPTTPTVRIEATPAAAPANHEPAEEPGEVIWSPPVVIDSAEIEIEMDAEIRKPAPRRIVPRAKSAGQKPRPIAVQKIAKTEKKTKKSKRERALVATEISAPKGAAASNGSGQVTITSNRSAMIFLDGRPTGKSAPTALVIPAGDHQITLLDPATKKAKTATVTIAANKSFSVRKEFD